MTTDEIQKMPDPDAVESADSSEHRREQAALQLAIAEKVCEGMAKRPGCGAIGQWKITHTDYPIRYLMCRKCGIPAKIVPK